LRQHGAQGDQVWVWGLGDPAKPGHIDAMSRIALAAIGGTLGFILYVMAVVALADHVQALHWVIELAYFIVAGLVWVWPAKALMFWAARGG